MNAEKLLMGVVAVMFARCLLLPRTQCRAEGPRPCCFDRATCLCKTRQTIYDSIRRAVRGMP